MPSKICGVTHPDDVDACLAHCVDAIGLNLWPGSRRALTLDDARPGPVLSVVEAACSDA